MYNCKKCGKNFDNKNSLGGHASSHSRSIGMMKKSKKYPLRQCLYCSNLFESKYPKVYCAMVCLKSHRKSIRRNKFIKFGNNTSDITNGFIEMYRKKYIFCEICGKSEKVITSRNGTKVSKLAMDHDHKTNEFRGLLCFQCNIQLGWYEKNKQSIENYMTKK